MKLPVNIEPNDTSVCHLNLVHLTIIFYNDANVVSNLNNLKATFCFNVLHVEQIF